MDVTGIKQAEKLTLVGELFRATEELKDKAAEARAKKREAEVKREKLREAVQVDESTRQRAAEETPSETRKDDAASNVAPTTPGQTGATPDQTGRIINITA